MVDPFYNHQNPYASAISSGMFQTGHTSYAASGLPALSFDHNGNMGLETDGSFYGNDSSNTHGSSSFASGMNGAADSASRTPLTNDPDFNNDAASIAMSSPGAYARYLHDDAKTKQEDYEPF